MDLFGSGNSRNVNNLMSVWSIYSMSRKGPLGGGKEPTFGNLSVKCRTEIQKEQRARALLKSATLRDATVRYRDSLGGYPITVWEGCYLLGGVVA